MKSNVNEKRNKVISFILTFVSIFIGIRIFNEFLRFNDRYSYKFETSYRKIANKDFCIKSKILIFLQLEKIPYY